MKLLFLFKIYFLAVAEKGTKKITGGPKT